MINLIWALMMGSAWIIVAIWLIPSIIAYQRGDRNLKIIFVLSVILSLIPFPWLSLIGYVGVLVFSMYRGPDLKVIQGPPGRDGKNGKDGEKGRDADEIPLSKSGVLKPREVDTAGN